MPVGEGQRDLLSMTRPLDDAASFDAAMRDAVAVVDAGDVEALERLLAANPALASRRLDAPGAWLRDTVGNALDGFFQRPYLLWFVAEDPIRNGRLPANIAAVAETIIATARRHDASSLQEQLDFALSLVAWSWIARQSGVQIALIDLLVDAGAALDGNADNALVNGNVDAARRLVERGAPLSLATALCLARWEDADRLAQTASGQQKQFALVLSALNGQPDAVRRALDAGADRDAPSPDLYSHGTPLHHAVSSGSLATVQVLVEAGATLEARDSLWGGTPLGWAEHYLSDGAVDAGGREYREIAAYLRAASGSPTG